MQLPQLYSVFHILFLLGVIALCVVTGMPTRYWRALAAWGRRRWLRVKGERLRKALALQGVNFLSDESFLDQGVGLAIDHERGLVFLAQPDGGQYQTAILSTSQLGAHTTVVRQEDGFQNCFVEISESGTATRKWLLPCADSALANEINNQLNKVF